MTYARPSGVSSWLMDTPCGCSKRTLCWVVGRWDWVDECEECGVTWRKYYNRSELDQLIKDQSREFDEFYRQELERARASGAEVYCIYHDCDAKSCPDDGVHGGD